MSNANLMTIDKLVRYGAMLEHLKFKTVGVESLCCNPSSKET
jgi:hypothetical protein